MSKKILVVDDERHIIYIVKFNLEKAGYNVITASNGEEAVLVATKEQPDLIILDLMMPKMTGFEACSIITKQVETLNIPVIILTAKGQEIDKDKALECGAKCFITKPFSPKALLKKVEEFL
jgi:two-component system alkaline phosphatase synthesis response regulator PhoP